MPSSPPNRRSRSTPQNALGTEPTTSHLTRFQFTVFCRMWTAPPKGFMTADVTMSLETAASGLTPKKNTSIGVMRAPPPIPVRPTTNPTTAPPTTNPTSMDTRSLSGPDYETRTSPRCRRSLMTPSTPSCSETTDVSTLRSASSGFSYGSEIPVNSGISPARARA